MVSNHHFNYHFQVHKIKAGGIAISALAKIISLFLIFLCTFLGHPFELFLNLTSYVDQRQQLSGNYTFTQIKLTIQTSSHLLMNLLEVSQADIKKKNLDISIIILIRVVFVFLLFE